MPPRVLMCPPTFFDVREKKNIYMGAPIDKLRAQQQWSELCRCMERLGLQVETIDPVSDLEDMVFAANTVFVGNHSVSGKFIVPSRMRYPVRQQEVDFYVQWFRSRGYRVIDLDLEGEYLEGHGDLIWNPDGSAIWAGYGFRSTRGGVERFAVAMQNLGVPVFPLALVDEHCYHLDTCFSPLSQEAVLAYAGAFSSESWELIRCKWQRVHEITRDEAYQFMCNGMLVRNSYITPHLSPRLQKILESEGVEAILVDTSEFEKSGGSVFCMKSLIE